jgi:SAM-dependent methyltransferase
MITPRSADLFAPNYVTYRRLWLDTLLQAFSGEMQGVVLDLGGKRENKRGTFRPPVSNIQAWWYLNLDLDTHPNLYADVGNLPLKSESVDIIICTEVLEHLKSPSACASEILRILRPGASAFVSTPFLYPVHADPFDFQRFTADGLQKLFEGCSKLEIFPMGGFWGVLGLFLELGLPGYPGKNLHHKILRRSLLWLARRLCAYDLVSCLSQPAAWQKFTTGYFLKATR